MSRPDPAPPSPHPEPLFYETGASWYWLLSGPAAAGALMWIQSSSGYGMQPLMPAIFLVLVSLFVGLQVKAARIHSSVELTEETLREGTETIRVDEIVGIYPQPKHLSRRKDKPEKWQRTRSLGELTGVPRGRVGIGLRLTGGRTVQAWARAHRPLRAALVSLVPYAAESSPPDPGVDDDDDTAESRW